MKHSNHIFNNKIKTMTRKELEDCLKELQANYMYSKTRYVQNLGVGDLRQIRRQIAMVKTELNIKGFSYHPR